MCIPESSVWLRASIQLSCMISIWSWQGASTLLKKHSPNFTFLLHQIGATIWHNHFLWRILGKVKSLSTKREFWWLGVQFYWKECNNSWIRLMFYVELWNYFSSFQLVSQHICLEIRKLIHISRKLSLDKFLVHLGWIQLIWFFWTQTIWYNSSSWEVALVVNFLRSDQICTSTLFDRILFSVGWNQPCSFFWKCNSFQREKRKEFPCLYRFQCYVMVMIFLWNAYKHLL
jgi:hypothetical protein